MSVSDNNKNRGAHGDSSSMLGWLRPSSENPPALAVGSVKDKYYVSEENKGKIFTVRSEPWMLCGTEVIKISDKAGGYAVDGLTKVD